MGDLAFQLYQNGGQIRCVDWGQVGVAAGAGALIGSGAELLAGLAEAEAGFFEGTSYSSKVLQQMGRGVGEFHSFPESVTAFADAGEVSSIVGADGQAYTVLRIPGSYTSSSGNVYNGTFEFIKDSNGIINHRLFVP